MRHVQAHRRWLPGGWCSFDRLRCSTYYAFFGPFLLNGKYTLLPVVEAIRQADRLFEVHGKDGRVFIRPDAVWKTFRGGPVSHAAFEGALAPACFDPTGLVLVSEPRNVEREWRLVVAQGGLGRAWGFLTTMLPFDVGIPSSITTIGSAWLGSFLLLLALRSRQPSPTGPVWPWIAVTLGTTVLFAVAAVGIRAALTGNHQGP